MKSRSFSPRASIRAIPQRWRPKRRKKASRRFRRSRRGRSANRRRSGPPIRPRRTGWRAARRVEGRLFALGHRGLDLPASCRRGVAAVRRAFVSVLSLQGGRGADWRDGSGGHAEGGSGSADARAKDDAGFVGIVCGRGVELGSSGAQRTLIRFLGLRTGGEA